MKNLKRKLDDYHNSIQSYSSIFDTIISTNTESESGIDYVIDKLVTLEIKHAEMETKQFKTEEKVVELQWRGMRENLIFKGIHEPKLMQGEFKNVELTLKNFLRNEMNIPTDIPFDRVHRMGRYNFPRPKVAKFERYKDKELVRSAAPKMLVGKPYGVYEQLPAEIENKRKLLYPEAKKAREIKTRKSGS